MIRVDKLKNATLMSYNQVDRKIEEAVDKANEPDIEIDIECNRKIIEKIISDLEDNGYDVNSDLGSIDHRLWIRW